MSRQVSSIRPNALKDSYTLPNVYADAICEDLAAYYFNEQAAYLIKAKGRALYSSLEYGHELLLGEVNDRIIGFDSGNNYARFILAFLESILILNGAFRMHTNSPFNAAKSYKERGYEALDGCTHTLGKDDHVNVAIITKTWFGGHYVK